ncbi:MAG: carboxypeptidase-like regulatory domain-containing protein, partial [Flavobacteriaceae bacterium]|nr:carboxypeptidase-like regulatory domain-containing protein [Flavobacteriaceae bacterium]
MKKILLFIILISGIQFSFAQKKYEKLWKEVETLELEGKFKSANETIEKILKKAKRSNQSDQIVKGFIYKSKFALLLHEDAKRKIINELEATIKTSAFPTNTILKSVYASFLTQYLQQNRYSIRKRSKIDFPLDSNAFEQWDINTFIIQIARHYEQSLSKSKELKKLSILGFQSILTDSKTSHRFRPTLYDFLVHRALEFYAQDKWYVKKPKAQFYINNPIVFESTDEFTEEPFYTTDSILSNRNVLKLYQNLEQFHQDKDTIAYIDVVLDRLQFSKKQATIENKKELYLKALKELSGRYSNHETFASIAYQIASFYFESSKKHNAKNDSELKDYRIKALEICNSVLEKYPNSDGGLLCTILKNKIEEQTISIQTERYVIPDKPFLAKVTFKSVDSLYMSVYKIPFEQFENLYSYKRDSVALEIVKKNNPSVSRFYKLQTQKNYYKYTTEIDFPKLDKGHYLIVASNKERAQSVDEVFSHSIVTATNLSMLSINKDKYLATKMLDRENGTPVKNVTISVTNSKGFNRNGTTNAQGECSIKKDKKYHNDLRLMATYQGDTLTNDNYYLQRLYNNDDEDDERLAKMFLYLDRSIYRPGQTMYFKGLLVEKKKGVSKVVTNTYVSVTIYDVNNEEVKEFRLKTNDFGSVSGEFKIPSNVLTGEFSIEMDEDYESDDETYFDKIDDFESAEVYFSVEEYKRPKFEVTFDVVTENYKLNDSIKVSGLAKAFLGSSISDAKVTYSISRELQPNWKNGYYGGNSQIIKTGNTTTSGKGVFEIDFIAVPDSLTKKATKPIFLYTIKADVTDTNGETRSASKTITLGFHNLQLDVTTSNTWDGTKPQKVTFETKNLNDQPISAQMSFSIYKLQSSERVLRKKPWKVVELPYLSKEKFTKLFPHEAYDSTDLKRYWKKGRLIFSKKKNITEATAVELKDISNWESGMYILEAKAVDIFKDTISVKKQFEVFQPRDQKLPDNKLFTYKISNSNFKVDGFVAVQLKTSCETLNVNIEAFYNGKSVLKEMVTIKNGRSLLKIPVKKSYKNKLDFNVFFVKYNSLYSDQFSVNFPEVDNELQIETLSFRNKLVPDQKETWSFKITDANTKNAEAEVLASMYDTSLDQFKEHNWKTDISFDTYNYSYAPRVQSDNFFGTTTFDLFNYPKSSPIFSFLKNYHKLKWFGFDFGGIGYDNKLYLSSLATKKKNPNYVEGNITGIITDESGLPLPGVNVIVKETSTGTTTDFDGFYSINAPIGSELVFSYIGFSNISTFVTKSGTYNVALEEDSAHLDEVVVTAMGIKKEKKALGYSVAYVTAEDVSEDITRKLSGKVTGVNITSTAGVSEAGSQIVIRGYSSIANNKQTLFIIDGVPMDSAGTQLASNDIEDISVLKGTSATALYGARAKNGVVIITTKKGLKSVTQVEVRSDLKETAFFFPHLKTNKKGEVIFSFDSPQALTKWRFMLLAHNKSVEVGALEKTAVTQKDINVISNPPRFLREKDTIYLSAKISNLTNETASGTALLQLFNGVTSEPISVSIIPLKSNQNFTIPSKGNTSVTWKLQIPEGIPAIEYKILAKSGSHSDGEANILPVLSNRTLVTEAKPLWLPKGTVKEVVFEKLKTSTSASLKNHSFILEYTSNPAWLAIKSLPYLIEFPYECAEQTFSRFYANALAEDILVKNPQVEDVFKSWKANGQLESSLETNESLKSVLVSESPWVRDLKSDQENKARLAELFDSQKVQEGQLQAVAKLKQLQLPSGGFPWFAGGRENTFITRHIVAGIGHLQKLNVQSENDYKLKPLLKKAITYLDTEFVGNYKNRLKHQKDSTDISLNHNTIHYLYARSFFLKNHPLSEKTNKIVNLFFEKCKSSWLTQSLYNKGMIALILVRNGFEQEAKNIVDALEEQAVQSNENGWYWKENVNSWYWYKSNIETQALLIEAFTEVSQDIEKVDKLKQWLLKNKQANKWGSTKATTEAIYALLTHGNNWLSVADNTLITIGNENIKTKKLDPIRKEAGTGYMKVNWKKEEISSKIASVKLQNKSDITGFGGVYWQYFEDLDKITSSENTPLSIKKSLFVKKTNSDGEKLIPITPNYKVKIGDLITVHIEIISKNDMEFVHLKDLRASGLEPIDVLSKYKWQDNIGYYQATKDVATHFFF